MSPAHYLRWLPFRYKIAWHKQWTAAALPNWHLHLSDEHDFNSNYTVVVPLTLTACFWFFDVSRQRYLIISAWCLQLLRRAELKPLWLCRRCYWNSLRQTIFRKARRGDNRFPTWLCTYQDYISVTARPVVQAWNENPRSWRETIFDCQKMAFRLISLPTPHHRGVLDARRKLFVSAHNGNHTGGMVLGTACRARHPTQSFQSALSPFHRSSFNWQTWRIHSPSLMNTIYRWSNRTVPFSVGCPNEKS